MNNIKKITIFLLFIIVGIMPVFAECLPKKYHNGFNPVDNPVWYKYMSNYKDQLYKAFNVRKFKEKKWGQIYIYNLNRDGSITDITNYSHMDKFDTYVKQVILDNPPPQFPKEIEDEKVKMDVSLWCSDHDDFYINYYSYKKTMELFVTKNHKHKNK